MVDLQEAKAITEGAVNGVMFGRLDELSTNTGSDTAVIINATIGKTLEIVQDTYHLVPKVKITVDEEPVDEPAPENALDVSLAEYWTSVNS